MIISREKDANYHNKDDKAEFVSPDRHETASLVAAVIIDRLASGDKARSRHSTVDADTGAMVSALSIYRTIFLEVPEAVGYNRPNRN